MSERNWPSLQEARACPLEFHVGFALPAPYARHSCLRRTPHSPRFVPWEKRKPPEIPFFSSVSRRGPPEPEAVREACAALHVAHQFGPRIDVEQPLRHGLQPVKLGDGFQRLLLSLGRGLAELLPALAVYYRAHPVGSAFCPEFLKYR